MCLKLCEISGYLDYTPQSHFLLIYEQLIVVEIY